MRMMLTLFNHCMHSWTMVRVGEVVHIMPHGYWVGCREGRTNGICGRIECPIQGDSRCLKLLQRFSTLESTKRDMPRIAKALPTSKGVLRSYDDAQAVTSSTKA